MGASELINIMGSVPEQYCLPSSVPPAIAESGINMKTTHTKMNFLYANIYLHLKFCCKITNNKSSKQIIRQKSDSCDGCDSCDSYFREGNIFESTIIYIHIYNSIYNKMFR